MRRDFDLKSGNVALTFALLLPALLAAAGAAFDYSRYHSARTSLQEVADAAAIAGARQFFLNAESSSAAEAVARQTAENAIGAQAADLGAVVGAEADTQLSRVDVKISAKLSSTLLSAIVADGFDITVDAAAEARGGGAGTCIIGLDPSARDTLMLNANAKIDGPRCAVYSNSTSNAGLAAFRNARIESGLTCTSGGYAGGAMNFSPMPLTDCPPREDPLANRPEPVVGACNHTRKQVDNFKGSLDPGVYCGGLVINGASDVTLNPGIYVIKGGPLEVLRTSKVRGENVGLFFTGKNADLYFQETSDISLSGPLSGVMAGVLIWQQNDPRAAKMFEVRSTKVHTLTGTIYLPNSTFYASVDAPVAQSSAYTAIVARKIALDGNVELVLNDDYGSTSVPVPGGIGAAGGEVFLRD
jgi:Flp pilus assembly protein TadG